MQNVDHIDYQKIEGSTLPKNFEGHIQKTSKTIAYGLIALFSACLISLLFAGVFSASETERTEWREQFKEGFLFLGGALTTVIGYYFGSRGTQEAEANAANARLEAERAKQVAEEERKKFIDAQESEAPTFSESALDEIPFLDE